jgi:hypothetical protein
VQEHHLLVQRACQVVRLSRAAFDRPPVPTTRRDAAVIAALTNVVARYPRCGFWKLFDRMRVEGPALESQTRAPRVLRPAVEFTPTDNTARAAARAATARGTAAAESDLGARLHDRTWLASRSSRMIARARVGAPCTTRTSSGRGQPRGGMVLRGGTTRTSQSYGPGQ